MRLTAISSFNCRGTEALSRAPGINTGQPDLNAGKKTVIGHAA